MGLIGRARAAAERVAGAAGGGGGRVVARPRQHHRARPPPRPPRLSTWGAGPALCCVPRRCECPGRDRAPARAAGARVACVRGGARLPGLTRRARDAVHQLPPARLGPGAAAAPERARRDCVRHALDLGGRPAGAAVRPRRARPRAGRAGRRRRRAGRAAERRARVGRARERGAARPRRRAVGRPGRRLRRHHQRARPPAACANGARWLQARCMRAAQGRPRACQRMSWWRLCGVPSEGRAEQHRCGGIRMRFGAVSTRKDGPACAPPRAAAGARRRRRLCRR